MPEIPGVIAKLKSSVKRSTPFIIAAIVNGAIGLEILISPSNKYNTPTHPNGKAITIESPPAPRPGPVTMLLINTNRQSPASENTITRAVIIRLSSLATSMLQLFVSPGSEVNSFYRIISLISSIMRLAILFAVVSEPLSE